MACELLVLSAGAAIVAEGQDADASSWGEVPKDLDVARVHQLDEILHDDIHTVLMEGTVITEAEEVELEALALNHLHIGDVADVYGRIVGLSGDGAEAGELGAVEAHPVVIALMLVGEGLEHLGGIVLPVLGLAPEDGEFVLAVSDTCHSDLNRSREVISKHGRRGHAGQRACR